MPKNSQTTAEALEELRRVFREAFEPPTRWLLKILTPPAEFIDRHKPPLRVRQALYVLTLPGCWLPWALGMGRPKMPRR